MNVSIYIGWWAVPLAVTLIAAVWALAPRAAEALKAGPFGPVGGAIVFVFRSLVATIVALLAWLVWALVI